MGRLGASELNEARRRFVVLLETAQKIESDTPEVFFRFTSIEGGVTFDIDGDGTLEQVAWTEHVNVIRYQGSLAIRTAKAETR